ARRPRAEMVRPRLDRELVARVLPDDELRRPAVVLEGAHGDLGPRRVGRALPEEDGAQEIVAVAEDVGLDVHDVADHALRGVAPAVAHGRPWTRAKATRCRARSPSARTGMYAPCSKTSRRSRRRPRPRQVTSSFARPVAGLARARAAVPAGSVSKSRRRPSRSE